MSARIKITLIISLILLVGSSCSWAQGPKFDITPFVGVRAGGSFEDNLSGKTLTVDASESYGLTVDMDYDATGQVHLLWSRQHSDFEAPGSTDGNLRLNIDYYHFGGTYSWGQDERYKPYVAFSVGATNFSPTDSGYSNELRFSMGLGLGLKYFLTPHIGLMVEGRGFGTLMGGVGTIFCSNDNCQIRVASELFTQIEARTGIVFRF